MPKSKDNPNHKPKRRPKRKLRRRAKQRLMKKQLMEMPKQRKKPRLKLKHLRPKLPKLRRSSTSRPRSSRLHRAGQMLPSLKELEYPSLLSSQRATIKLKNYPPTSCPKS